MEFLRFHFIPEDLIWHEIADTVILMKECLFIHTELIISLLRDICIKVTAVNYGNKENTMKKIFN